MLKEDIAKAKSNGWQSAVVVGEYLLTREDVDTNKNGKSLTQCMDYIMSEAKKKAKKGSCCMSDEEVFGLAVHYYDESNLKVPKVQGISSFVSESAEQSVNQKTLENLKKAMKELEAAKQELREKDKKLEEVTNSLNNAKKESEPTPKKEAKPKKKKAKPVERYVEETLF